MATIYESFLERGRRQYGKAFDPSDLDPRFVRYMNSGVRIKVRTCGIELTGTVGVTSGRSPVFILMRTNRSTGSSWLLVPKDILLAVQKNGRKYVPVTGSGGVNCTLCGHHMTWGELHKVNPHHRTKCPGCKGYFFEE